MDTESSSFSPKIVGEINPVLLCFVKSELDAVLPVRVLAVGLSWECFRISFIGSASSKYEISSSYSPITISFSGSH